MDTRSPLDARASGLMLLLCLLWSLQQVSLKAMADAVSPMLMIGLRSGIAAVLVGLVCLRDGRALLRSGRWRMGLVVGALFALEYLLVAEALRLTHASHVVVFLYTAPIFAALGLHARIPAERLRRLQWLGIALAFAGVALAFLGGNGGARQVDARLLLGDGLALLAGVAWGATTYAIRCSALSTAPAAETLLYQLTGACVLLLPAAWLLGQDRFVPGAAVWWHLAFQSLVVSFASFLVWFWLLRHYLASPLGVFAFLTPVLGVALGVWLLGEPLEPVFVAGSALVLMGVVLVVAHGWVARLAARLGLGRVARA